MRRLDLDDVLRGALRDHGAAAGATLGPHVDDPVRGLDHVEIVLDDDDGVALVHQPLQNEHEFADVLEVQARRRLVEDVHRAAIGALLQLRRQLHALRLATRQRRRRLAQTHVAQADVDEGVQVPGDGLDRLEELRGLRNRHVQDLGDGLSLVQHLEGLAVVPGPVAHLAGHVDVGQEVHLDLQRAVALARLAPAALDVEAEAARLVAAHLRLLRIGEQVPDLVEHARVRRRIRPRRAADRRLVDLHQLVQLIQALHAGMAPRHLAGAVELVRHHLGQDLVDQRRLARTGHAGHAGQQPQRKVDVDVLQVVLPGTADGDQPVEVDRAALLRREDLPPARQIIARDRPLRIEDAPRLTRVDDLAAVLAGARADVDQPIAFPDRVLVMLDDDERVAQIAQLFQRLDQPVVVALVQADRRLVEDVQDARQTRADLGGQSDALRLATGQRSRRPFQRQIIQPDVEQETQARLHLAQHAAGDHLLAFAQGQRIEERRTIRDRQRRQTRDRLLAETLRRKRHRQDLRAQTGAAARAARHLAHVTLVALLLRLAVRLLQLPVQVRHDALERRRVLAGAAVTVAVPHADLVLRPVHQRLVLRLRQILQRRRRIEAHRIGQPRDQLLEVLLVQGPVPRPDRLGHRLRRIRDDQILVDLQLRAQAIAGRAGAVRGVERKRPRLEFLDVDPVPVGARDVLGKTLQPVLVIVVKPDRIDDHHAIGQAQRRLHRIGQALLLRRLDLQAVHHDVDVVLDLLLQRRRIRQAVHLAVDDDARIPLGGQLGEEIDELALAGAHHRSQHLEFGALRHLQHLIDDLLRGLRRNDLAAGRAMRRTGAGEEETQVVVHLGDGADRRPRVPVGRLLVDGHRRRQALDQLDLGFFHLPQEHAGIGAQRLDVTALPLREDRVERQRRLARPRQTGEHHHLVAGEVDVDALEIVLPGTTDDEPFGQRAHLS